MSKAASPEEIQTQSVAVVVHRKPACCVELEVKAPPALVAAARKDAIKKVGKEVSFPGFRKGKAPEAIIVKNYPGAVEQQWHKSIADAAFAAAQTQERIPVLNGGAGGASITFDLKKHSLEEGAELTFSFETEPQIPAIDPKLFSPKPIEKAEVGEKQVEEAIRQMRFFYARWKPIEERGIQEGDYILIDLETFDGDEPQKVFDHIRFEVSKERMSEWMKRLVLGAKAGDVIDGVSEADETASEEEKKEFTPKKVRLTIHRAEQAELPELDDEFAKKVGAENLEALRESVRSILDRNAEEKVQSDLREQVNDFLIRTYSFEMPLSLIESERKHRKTQFMSDPDSAGRYEKLDAEEKKKFDQKIYSESSHAVSLFYLTRHIVRQEQIPVSHEEVQLEAARSAGAFGQKVDPDQLPKETFALALSKVIMAKAQDHILKHCNATQQENA